MRKRNRRKRLSIITIRWDKMKIYIVISIIWGFIIGVMSCAWITEPYCFIKSKGIYVLTCFILSEIYFIKESFKQNNKGDSNGRRKKK